MALLGSRAPLGKVELVRAEAEAAVRIRARAAWAAREPSVAVGVGAAVEQPSAGRAALALMDM